MRSFRLLVYGLLALSISGCIDNEDVKDPNEQMANDTAIIDSYVESKNISVIKDKSGVQFHIEKLGTGLPPRLDQTISFTYIGKLLNGNVFDQGGNATGVLNDYIDGWRAAISVWPAGTTGTIFVPSPLGYGSSAVGTIPPNSVLIFDVTLKEVVLTNTEKARFAADVDAIDNHLAKNKITAVKDTTGVRYVIVSPGTGNPPSWYQKVRFNYSGKILDSGFEFFSGTAQPSETFDSRMIDYLHGIKIGLSKIGVGGKIIVYTPSGLAFGPYENTAGPVPANSNVVYTIELTELP